jgi:hypothetical protein
MQPDNPASTQLEESELDTLIEQGVTFTIPKRSLLRYLGKPERTFLLRQPYLRTLDRLSKEWIKIDVSLDKLREDFVAEGKQMALQHAIRYSRIIAISYLNSEWKIRLFGWLVAYYFSCRITPQKLLSLTLLINETSNLVDFINSTRLMSANRATTTPARVENLPEED